MRKELTIVLLFTLLLIATLPDHAEPQLDAINKIQSDVYTSVQNTTYFITVGGHSATFKNNSINKFGIAVDIIEFGSNVFAWYDIQFRYTFKNESLGWYHEVYGNDDGTITSSKYRQEIYSQYINETFPAEFTIDVTIAFTENGFDGYDSRQASAWSDLIQLRVVNGGDPADVDDRNTIITITETMTEGISTTTEQITNTITENIIIHAPHVDFSPNDFTVDVDTAYSLTWNITATNPKNYRLNVTDGTQMNILIQGSYTSGQFITWNSIPATEVVNLYKFIFEADDDEGLYYYDEVFVTVMNFTLYNELFPGLSDQLTSDYPNAPALGVPISTTPIFVSLFVTVVAYRIKNKED